MVIINNDDNDNNSKQMDKLTRIHPISMYNMCQNDESKSVGGRNGALFIYAVWKNTIPEINKTKAEINDSFAFVFVSQ